MENIQSVMDDWQVIEYYYEWNHPESAAIQSREIKKARGWLERQIAQVEKPVEQPAIDASQFVKESVVQTPELVQKGAVDESESFQQPATKIPETVRARLELSASDEVLVKRYNPLIGVVPIEGPVKSPGVVHAQDMATLMQGGLLTDTVIDGYLALLAHTANGHFTEHPRPKTPPVVYMGHMVSPNASK